MTVFIHFLIRSLPNRLLFFLPPDSLPGPLAFGLPWVRGRHFPEARGWVLVFQTHRALGGTV